MPKRGHIPERTCVACRKKFFKFDLCRFVRDDHHFIFDEGGILPGRGAYLCKNCFEKRDIQKIQTKLKKALGLGGK